MVKSSKPGLANFIGFILGQRGSIGKDFQYSDILSSVFYIDFCGADCLEDINTFGSQLSINKEASADFMSIDGLGELKEKVVQPVKDFGSVQIEVLDYLKA